MSANAPASDCSFIDNMTISTKENGSESDADNGGTLRSGGAPALTIARSHMVILPQ